MVEQPKRIQRRRTKGWRMPDGAVYVGRPTRWGNPLPGSLKGLTTGQVVAGFRALVTLRFATFDTVEQYITVDATDVAQPVPTVDEIREHLAGKDLVCWCPEGQPCHADVLLELANTTPDVVRVLHLYGTRKDRTDMLAVASTLVTTAHHALHHWRPWTAAVLTESETLPAQHTPDITRGERWANLAVLAAFAFIIGVVVWNVAVR